MRILIRIGILVFFACVAYATAGVMPPGANTNVNVATDALLTVVIAITGVTVPLIIVYRANANIDIRRELASMIERCFASNGIPVADFIGACTDDQAHTNGDGTRARIPTAPAGRPWRPQIGVEQPPGHQDARVLFVLARAYICQDQYDHTKHRYSKFPADIKKWLLDNMQFRQWTFGVLFDDSEDHSLSLCLMFSLIVSAAFAFVDLYIRHLDPATGWDGIFGELGARFLVLFNVAANFLTYILLGWFVSQRNFFMVHLDYSVWKLCPLAIPEIRAYQQQQQHLIDEASSNMRHATPHK
jgi:hypothetical protein